MIHNKERWNKKILEMFSLPNNTKISYFRNPKEFNFFDIEKINPNHVSLLWGHLKKKYRKNIKQKIILMGKIRIPVILFFNRLFDDFVLFIDKYVLSTNVIEITISLTVVFSLFCLIYFCAFNSSLSGIPIELLRSKIC